MSLFTRDEVVERLRSMIGKGKRWATQAQCAAELNLSTALISYTLNNADRPGNEKVHPRILEALGLECAGLYSEK